MPISGPIPEQIVTLGYERKYAIKLLQRRPEPIAPRGRPGPEPKYEGVQEIVERIWSRAEHLCGKRLAPALELWLPHYQRHYGRFLPVQKRLLSTVSAATLDRLLVDCKARAGGGKSDTVITSEGISIFDDEDLQIEAADPMAKTEIAPSLVE